MSKKTTPAEEKYSSYELEVLAVIQAVKRFRIYLLGVAFKIITDCSAFQRTMNKKDLTTRVARWALLLEEYNYKIEHREGKRLPHVDALSRYPVSIMNIKEDGILQRIKLAQEKDEYLLTIKKILEQTQEYDNYYVKNDVLYKYDSGQELLVAPKALQTEIIRKAHEKGHFAVKKTEEVIRQDFFIPKLKEKIEKCISNCIPCILGSRKEGKKEGFLHSIPKEGPLCTYHADHLGPMTSTGKNYQYLLAIVDDFSKFTWLYPTKSTTVKETLSCFAKQQKVFGNPIRIITDKGSAFTAKEFQEYCKDENIQHITTTTGVPRGNGQVERMNRTIIPVLTKLSLEDPNKWFKYVDRVQRAMNGTYQRSINTTPFEVLTGVKMRNKEDVSLNEILEEEVIRQFADDREEMRKECKKQILKVQEENKRTYNLRRKRPQKYRMGELVAIKRTQFGSGLKIHRKYLGPYEVTKVKGNERYDVRKIGHHEGPVNTSTCAEYMKAWMNNYGESESDSNQEGRDVDGTIFNSAI